MSSPRDFHLFSFTFSPEKGATLNTPNSEKAEMERKTDENKADSSIESKPVQRVYDPQYFLIKKRYFKRLNLDVSKSHDVAPTPLSKVTEPDGGTAPSIHAMSNPILIPTSSTQKKILKKLKKLTPENSLLENKASVPIKKKPEGSKGSARCPLPPAAVYSPDSSPENNVSYLPSSSPSSGQNPFASLSSYARKKSRQAGADNDIAVMTGGIKISL